MISALRTIASKLAAVGLLAALVFAVYAWVAEPLLARRAVARDNVETQRMLLVRLAASPAARAMETGDTAAAPPTIPPERIFLQGESDTIRAAELQSTVRDKASEAGIRLQSAVTVPKRSERGLSLIGVEVQFQASLPEFQRLLFDVETAEPFLFVEQLRVSRAPDYQARAGKDLDVRLVISGAAEAGDGP